jgi:hypothetical protein
MLGLACGVQVSRRRFQGLGAVCIPQAGPQKGGFFMVSLLSALWVCWGSITVALAGVLIYRSLLAMKEEDQLFLDPAEWHLEREQRAILTQLHKLTPLIRRLAVVSAVLLALIAGIWIYRGVIGLTDSSWQSSVLYAGPCLAARSNELLAYASL